jgi:predicted transcriptional regulator
VIAAALPQEPEALYVAIRDRLEKAHGISVRAMPDETMVGALRFYDFHRRRLMLSERLAGSSRLFALAYQLCIVELEAPIIAMLERAAPDAETMTLAKVMLVNYAAAAIVMPYTRFYRAAEETRYDLDALEARFGASFEQVAHRLTTLARPSEKGVPFFMLKVDIAGTISKRFSGGGLPLARYGGACPRWNLYRAFQTPGRVLAEIVEMPDQQRYFTMSRTVTRAVRDPTARSSSAIALGCDVKQAPRIVFADAALAGAANPIGPACHLCERRNCPDRALPPVTRALEIGQYQRRASAYNFRAI